MTLQLTIPTELERSLLAEVSAGRHASVEDAILEKISRREDPELLAATVGGADTLRRDLNDAWDRRGDAVDGQMTFDRLAAKSASLRAQGK